MWFLKIIYFLEKNANIFKKKTYLDVPFVESTGKNVSNSCGGSGPVS